MAQTVWTLYIENDNTMIPLTDDDGNPLLFTSYEDIVDERRDYPLSVISSAQTQHATCHSPRVTNDIRQV